MTKCTLQWRCPMGLRPGICCSECSINDTCLDACKNDPGRCMVSRAETDREILANFGLKFVKTKSEFMQIVEGKEPLGIFWYRSHNGDYSPYFIAIDNRSGEPVMSEKFGTKDELLHWIASRIDKSLGRR